MQYTYTAICVRCPCSDDVPSVHAIANAACPAVQPTALHRTHTRTHPPPPQSHATAHGDVYLSVAPQKTRCTASSTVRQ